MCGKSAIIFWPGEQRKSLDDIRRLQKSAMPEGLNVHKRVWWGGPVSKSKFSFRKYKHYKEFFSMNWNEFVINTLQ